jgi:hypothetical protein
LLDLLGARFIVESPGGRFREAGDEARFPLIHESDGVRVYANPRAVPRAYVALQAEVITTPERVLDRLVDPTFDPTKVVILEKQPPEIAAVPPTETPPTAQILSYEPGTVEIAATTESPGFLVLTDQYYPGWTADVDGRPTPIYRADYMVRAVPLSAGSHRVRFRFVPWSFYQGLGLAGIGVLLIVALTVADAWRVRRVRAGR